MGLGDCCYLRCPVSVWELPWAARSPGCLSTHNGLRRRQAHVRMSWHAYTDSECIHKLQAERCALPSLAVSLKVCTAPGGLTTLTL